MSWSRVAQTNSNKKTKVLSIVNNLQKQKGAEKNFESIDEIPRHKEITSHRNDDFIMINKEKNKTKLYQSPLDIILKRPLTAELTVYGFIRKQKEFYPKKK
eukprot:251865_1